MSRPRYALIVLLIALAVVMTWVFYQPDPDFSALPPRAPEGPGRAVPGSSAPQSKTPNSQPRTEAAAAASPAAATLNAARSDIRADLRALDEIIATFRSNFPQGGNPVGTNAEITAALTGRNKLGLALIPPNHPAINADGELCDRWGTPFFFHAESATRMTLRSAGPDKKMWNDDDVAFSP